MKKMVLSAFACIMLAGTMNASNEVNLFNVEIAKIVVADCNWSVIVVDGKGNIVDRKEYSGSEGAIDCLGLAAGQIGRFQAQYPSLTVKYIAGGTDGPK